MRRPIPAPIIWVVAGLLGFAGVVAYLFITSDKIPDFLALVLSLPGMAVLLIALWLADTRQVSRSASNVALASFSFGLILLTVLRFLRVSGWLYFGLGSGGFIVGGAGAWYIFAREWPAIRERREPVFIKANRLFVIGWALIVLSGLIIFLGPSHLLPLVLMRDVPWVTGVVLVDLAVIVAQRASEIPNQ